MNLKPDTLQRIDEVIPHYPSKRSASLPLLHLVQEDLGFVSDEAVEWIAAKLELQPINVYELVTFYPMFRRQPIGRRHIKVCRTLSCALVGGYKTCAEFERQFGTHLGETSPDGEVTVEFVECLASCGTAPVVMIDEVLHEKVGIVAGVMNTIHSYTNDQVLTDVYHSDLRRARSATMSMIPTKTGAAAAVGLVLPELAGKIDGFAIRVPTINVSLVDLSFTAARKTTVEEIHATVKAAAGGALKGILAYTDQPLVSVDFNHDPASSTYDSSLTKVMEGNLVKVCAWYDNEWGFSNRMLDTTMAWSKAA